MTWQKMLKIVIAFLLSSYTLDFTFEPTTPTDLPVTRAENKADISTLSWDFEL